LYFLILLFQLHSTRTKSYMNLYQQWEMKTWRKARFEINATSNSFAFSVLIMFCHC
jgi:hypothetical protein